MLTYKKDPVVVSAKFLRPVQFVQLQMSKGWDTSLMYYNEYFLQPYRSVLYRGRECTNPFQKDKFLNRRFPHESSGLNENVIKFYKGEREAFTSFADSLLSSFIIDERVNEAVRECIKRGQFRDASL